MELMLAAGHEEIDDGSGIRAVRFIVDGEYLVSDDGDGLGVRRVEDDK
jgi:hypothetical protein